MTPFITIVAPPPIVQNAKNFSISCLPNPWNRLIITRNQPTQITSKNRSYLERKNKETPAKTNILNPKNGGGWFRWFSFFNESFLKVPKCSFSGKRNESTRNIETDPHHHPTEPPDRSTWIFPSKIGGTKFHDLRFHLISVLRVDEKNLQATKVMDVIVMKLHLDFCYLYFYTKMCLMCLKICFFINVGFGENNCNWWFIVLKFVRYPFLWQINSVRDLLIHCLEVRDRLRLLNNWSRFHLSSPKIGHLKAELPGKLFFHDTPAENYRITPARKPFSPHQKKLFNQLALVFQNYSKTLLGSVLGPLKGPFTSPQEVWILWLHSHRFSQGMTGRLG